MDIKGAKTVTLPEDSDIVVMAMTVTQTGNQDAKPLALLYDSVEVSDAPKYHLTVEGAVGTGEYAAGKLVLVYTSHYKDGEVFAGWEGDCILAEYGSSAVIRMPEQDTLVRANRKSLGNDVLLNKPCKASAEVNQQETGAHALNGNDTSKWCDITTKGNHWLEVDAGEVATVNRWLVMHAGAKEASSWNTREFKLEYKVNETDEWSVADHVTDNEENITLREFAAVEGRYFRLWIEQATQDVRDTTSRIFMFQVFSV